MNQFAALDLKVSIGPEKVTSLFGVTITNSMLTGLLGVIITIIILFYVASRLKRGKYNRFVGLVQWVFEGLLHQVNDIIPDKKLASRVGPFAITIFFLVLVSYSLSAFPGLETIKWNSVPLLRSMAADLNFTLALALMTMVLVQMYAIKYLGVFGNVKRYLRNPLKDPIGAFEGALEVIGEFSRGVALALRLFGNAFAGEILLIVISVLTSYAATVVLPIFMGFELFIGFIQAYVFFVLALIFTSLAVSYEHHGPAESHESVRDDTMKAVKEGE